MVRKLIIVTIILILSGCSRGGSDGAGQSGPEPVLSYASPSKIMLGGYLSDILLYGKNLKNPEFWLNGEYYYTTNYSVINSSILRLSNINTIPNDLPGSLKIQVRTEEGLSNPLYIEYYDPGQGPMPFNSAAGYFLAANQYTPYNIVVSDVDGDNIDDVLVPEEQSKSFFILKGRSDGTLDKSRRINCSASNVIASGDVNGDNANDLVLADSASSQTLLEILANDGNGNFHQLTTLTVPGSYTDTLLLEDMNGDSQNDLLFSTSNPNYIHLALNNNGTFGDPIQLISPSPNDISFSVSDFNMDGRKDVLYTHFDSDTSRDEIRFLLQNSDGSFSDYLPTELSGTNAHTTIIDFDLDGNPDLAVQELSSSIGISLNIYRNIGNASFTAVSPQTIPPPLNDPAYNNYGFSIYEFVVADFDNDGYLDMAGVNGESHPSHILYLWGNGLGWFTPQWAVGPYGGGINNGFNIATGDVNGDGLSDIVATNRNAVISMLLGRNDRNQPSAVSLYPNVGGRVHDLGKPSAADVNGDGFNDLFIPGDGQYGGTLYFNTGNDNFNKYDSLVNPFIVRIADLNYDGYAEFIGVNNDTILIWPGDKDQEFETDAIEIVIPPENNYPFEVRSLQFADMDRNGLMDIVAGDRNDGIIVYTLNEWNFEVIAEDFNSSFIIDDFNADGRMDLASPGITYLGAYNRTFRRVEYVVLSGYSEEYPKGSGDINGDGYPDIAVSTRDGVVLFYNFGIGHDGGFYRHSVLLPGREMAGIVVHDFTGNGLSDIVVSLETVEQSVLFTNDGQDHFSRSYFTNGVHFRQIMSSDFNNDFIPDLVFTNFFLNFRPMNVTVVFSK